MDSLLLITSSIHGANGHSTRLAGQLAQRLASEHSLTVCTRNLTKDNLPHLSEEEVQAWQIPKLKRSSKQDRLARLSDQLIDELQSAREVVVAMPMYNFGVPSTFKSWIDRVSRAGVTFKYSNEGPTGLLDNKPVHVVCTRGGFYEGGQDDFQTPYLQKVFAFLGLEDLRFIYAEGLNTENKVNCLNKAQLAISQFG